MEFLYEYGLFLAKAVTIVVAIVLTIAGIAAVASKPKGKKGQLGVTDLTQGLREAQAYMKSMILNKADLKEAEKEEKKAAKARDKSNESLPKTFVIDFKGSMDAHEVDSLREEISAVLSIANKDDEVLIRLESPGGVVHGYGLAASQIQRIKQAGLRLTIAVDKVAASGGYMMACVADHLVAAPFAMIGSIGVVGQLPNFNKLLKKSNIEFEQHTAGEFKRTLTMFGENTEKGREKFKNEIEDVHNLFKDFVQKSRPDMDIAKVATGEVWYGQQALAIGLIDQISTSDDLLMEKCNSAQVFSVKYEIKKGLKDKLPVAAAAMVDRFFGNLALKSYQYFK